jgi:hypothetical protein
VIPIPPPGDESQTRDWRRNRWNPDRLRRFLDILGDSGGIEDLAVPVPWTGRKRAMFRALSGELDEAADLRKERGDLLRQLRFDVEQLKPDALMMTRMILTREYDSMEEAYMATLPRTWVESVVPAYASFERAERELSLAAPGAGARSVPTAEVVGWELLVPEVPIASKRNWSDERSLEAAAALARTDDYRLERETFRDWWRKEVGAGRPPEDALRELTKRADRLNEIARGKAGKTRTLRSFAVFGGAAGVAGVWFPPVAIAGGVLALVSVGADWVLKDKSQPTALAPAAMFHSARKQLGWY